MSNVHYDSHSPYMAFNENELRNLEVVLNSWFYQHIDMMDNPKYKATTEYLHFVSTTLGHIRMGLKEIKEKCS